MTKLYSYVVATDSGFAPNPFYGFCTLANCKPRIRKYAKTDDWIIGTGPKARGRYGHLVYAMRITETLTFDEFWADGRFRQKRPDMQGGKQRACGDNIYSRAPFTGERSQMPSLHSLSDGRPNEYFIEHDTHPDTVLVSTDFIYWGGRGPEIPAFAGVNICGGRGHRCRFPTEVVIDFVTWVRKLSAWGYQGNPTTWGSGACLPASGTETFSSADQCHRQTPVKASVCRPKVCNV